jgi:uncharacterized delta-60 repeat protein
MSNRRCDISKIVYLISLILPILIFSQVDTAWVRRYNGPGNSNDGANAIKLDNQGNVYVTGYSAGLNGNYDYATIKYNSANIQQWVARYNGPSDSSDYATAIVIDTFGNIYVTGYSFNSGTNYDYATIKYNTNGDTVWVRRYNGPGDSIDRPYSIVVDNLDNIYVTGWSYGSGSSDDYATIKYNTNGDLVWVRRYNGPGNGDDQPWMVTTDDSCNVYVTGKSLGSGTNFDYATIKYNASGVEQWVARYNDSGNSWDEAFAIAIDDSTNIYVTGWSNMPADYVTIKYNAFGIEQWVATYTGWGGWDRAFALVVDKQNDIYVTGMSSSGLYGTDIATIKYNTNGVQQWVDRFMGIFMPEAMVLDTLSNVCITGYRGHLNDEGTDFITLKYNTQGILLWVRYYGPFNNSYNRASDIAIDGSNIVYVTGGSAGSGTGLDYLTIKYVEGQGVEENHQPLCADRLSLKVYPNPVKTLTAIRYSLPVKGQVSLQLFDISGRLVKALVNQEKNTGNYSLIWNGTDENNRKVGEGVYFCILKTDEKCLKSKILVIK